MRETKILYPLDTDMPQTEVKMHKDTWKSIKKHLDDMREGEDITFERLFLELKITEENYLLAVRSSLNTMFLFKITVVPQLQPQKIVHCSGQVEQFISLYLPTQIPFPCLLSWVKTH